MHLGSAQRKLCLHTTLFLLITNGASLHCYNNAYYFLYTIAVVVTRVCFLAVAINAL